MLLGRGAAREGAQIAAPPGLRILLARMEPVFAGGEPADHVTSFLIANVWSLTSWPPGLATMTDFLP